MTAGVVFWVLMIVWLVFGAWSYFPRGENANFAPVGGTLLLWVLLALLGWKVFGSPIQ